MADNTTLYIIIGLVLLFTLMSANAQPSATGGPAMSAYLRRRATMPEFIEHVPTMPQVLLNQPKPQYIRERQKAVLPLYLRGTLGASRLPNQEIQGLGKLRN
jgi:hypothetical protein